MSSRVNVKEIAAGILCIAIGGFFVFQSIMTLPIDSARQMGPGYFPLAVGLILVVLGLFIGLLFGLFTTGESWILVVLISVLVAALWGAIFGFVGHWATRGHRDFSSFQTLDAGRYDVYVEAEHATEAANFLG